MKYFLEKPAGGLARIGDLDSPGVAQEIGGGGAGRVLRPTARAFAGQLIKLYHTGPKDYAARHERKVRRMIAAPPADLQCGGKLAELAWPQAAVRDANGKFRGFLMPEVGAFGLDQVLQPLLRRKHRISEAMFFRLSLARSLATLIDALHQTGYCVIDLKPENVRVARAGAFGREGAVGLIDTDGFAFSGTDGIAFAAGFATEEYLYPRILNFERDVPRHAREQDRWALAVLVFQLLNDNIHPLSGIDNPAVRDVHPAAMLERARFQPSLYAYGQQAHPHVQPAPGSLHAAFSPALRELLDRAFSGRLDPPAPAEWVALLTELAHPRQRCRRDRHHWRYGERCGACALEGRATTHPTTKTPRRRPAGEQTAGHHQAKRAPAATRRHSGRAPPPARAVNSAQHARGPRAPVWPWLIVGLIASAFAYALSWVDLDGIASPASAGVPVSPSTRPSPDPSQRASLPGTGPSTTSSGPRVRVGTVHPATPLPPGGGPSRPPPPVVPRKIDGSAQTAPPPEDLTQAEARAIQRLPASARIRSGSGRRHRRSANHNRDPRLCP